MELSERIAATGNAVSNAPDHFTEIKDRIHSELVNALGPQLYKAEVGSSDLRDRVRNEIRTRLAQERGLSLSDLETLIEEITDDTLGHGPLEKLLADETVTEIMVNGDSDVWVERKGRLYPTKIHFSDDAHLRRIINKIVGQVGRRIDESSPMVDARLPDGSRINAVIPPLSLSGPLVTIRKFSKKRLDLDDLVQLGTLSPESVEILDVCLKGELNILISGGTGSGKTTLLNAMSTRIPNSERIVTIEDAAELRLNQRHVLRLEARPANIEGEGEIKIRDLVRNSLRMRPDRIIVGEVRGPEALDMLQAMNTGHDGSLSTVHANTTRDALSRVETMVLMAGYDLPVRVIRGQIASAIDLLIHIDRLPDGSRKIVSITEVQNMEGDVITTQDLFTYKIEQNANMGYAGGRLVSTGLRPNFLKKLQIKNVQIPPIFTGIRPESNQNVGLVSNPAMVNGSSNAYPTDFSRRNAK